MALSTHKQSADATGTDFTVDVVAGSTAVTGVTLIEVGGAHVVVSDANPFPVTISGVATAANQSTGNTALSAIQTAVEGTLTVDLGANNDVTVTGAALTALQLIDDAIYTSGIGTPSKGIMLQGTDGTVPRNIRVRNVGLGENYAMAVDVIGGSSPSLHADGVTPGSPNGGYVNAQTFPLMFNASGEVYRFKGDSTDGLLVNLGSNNDVTVTGTVTVDLGANNDVTLATLPDTSAGDLAAINAALAGTLTVDLGVNNDVTVTGTVTVDGSGVTQPVSAASLPLPSGAATSANQSAAATLTGAVDETAPASDTANSGLNGRLQRIAQRLTSLIAQLPASLGIKTAANSLSVAPASDAAFTTVVSGGNITAQLSVSDAAMQDAINANADAIKTAVEGTLTVDLGANNDVTLTTLPDTSAGDLAAINAALAGTLTVDGSGVTQPVSLSSVPSHDVTNAGTFAVQSVSTQSGTWTVQPGNTANTTPWLVTANLSATDNAVLDAIAASVAGTLTVDLGANNDVTVTGTVTVDGSGVTQPVSLASVPSHAVTNAGTFAVQAASTQSGTWTVQPGNTANTTPWLVNDRPATSGGLSSYTFLSTAAVQAASIKGSAGQLYSMEFFNTGATPMYVRLYNQAGSPGTGDGANIKWRGVIPGNTAGAGFVKNWDKGIAFSTGIGIRVTGAVGSTDATALAANVISGNVEYS